MKIGIITGSLRKESYNRKIGKEIVRRYDKKADFNIIEIIDLPVFNEDLEDDLPESVIKLRREIKSCDGIIIVTPEYNHSIPGGLKNAFDWLSRDDYAMMKKPYLLMGASSGSIGTTRAQAQVRQVLNAGAFQMKSIPGNEFLIANVQDRLDDDGRLIDQGTIKRLDKKIDDFIKWIELVG